MHTVLLYESHDSYALALAERLTVSSVLFEQGKFADGETWFRVGDILPKSSIILIYRFNSSLVINDQLCSLLLLIAKIKKENKSGKITLILPYFPYARQDKDKNSLNDMVASMLAHAGVTDCVTYDIHSPVTIKSSLSIQSLDISDMWLNIAKKIIQNPKEWSIAAPDEGGKFRSQQLAERLGTEVVFISKMRSEPDHVASSNLLGNVAGRSVILVDDIISTGRTAVSACQELLDQGAKEVIAFFTHAVLAPGAKERIDASGFTSVYVTDTLLLTDNALPKKGVIVRIDQYCTMLLNVLTKNEYQQKSANSKVQ